MPISPEIAKIAVLAGLVPLAVFSANWIHRSHKGYAQTAAADFILAIVIFDMTVVIAAGDFEPFLRSAELRSLIVYWHFSIAFISGLVWSMIVSWGEPKLASYYETKTSKKRGSFPIFTFCACWMPVLILVSVHVGFFVVRKSHG